MVSLTPYRTLDISTPEDTNPSDPFDVTTLTVSDIRTIVVSDYNNSSVKSFFTRHDSDSYSILKLTSFPWQLAKVTRNKLAVTVPGSRTIVVFKVSPELDQQATIHTRVMYWGLTALDSSTLVAGADYSSCVDILDLDGHVLRSIQAEDIGQDLLQEPDFLCSTTDGNILVSDSGSKSLFCMTPYGAVVFVYSHTEATSRDRPGGVTVTTSGHISFVDDKVHTLVQLTEKGEVVMKTAMPDESKDNCFGLCSDEEHFYIAVRDKHVHVYNFA
ncbi:uncharacterized protein [Haliotis cracherodii]|uniref:uncharacterized protein n=1 Tax=Haliotis cracherodii TaxID=6455 RepID=UPI0039E76B6A